MNADHFIALSRMSINYLYDHAIVNAFELSDDLFPGVHAWPPTATHALMTQLSAGNHCTLTFYGSEAEYIEGVRAAAATPRMHYQGYMWDLGTNKTHHSSQWSCLIAAPKTVVINVGC